MIETELQLELMPADLDKLVRSELLGERADVIGQHVVYFDTSDHRLRGAGFTLRIRRSGDERMQTINAIGPGASLFARSEWETSVASDTPVLDHSSPLLNELGPIATELSPQFAISVERQVWNLTENGSEIEAVIDTGLIKAGDRQTPIFEMELELTDGHPRDLFALARRIDAIAPFKFGVLSKAERGYRLLRVQRTVYKAEPIDLGHGATVADAFQAIAGSCFRQFRLNETVLFERKNPEALHQARVALRRLRSAFSLFKPILPDETGKRLSGEFRWLAATLGEARNLDVLVRKSDELRERLITARTVAYEEVLEDLCSFRARALMLDFNAWLRCGEFLNHSDALETPRKSSAEFACEALDRSRKKLKKHGRNLANVDDEHRHEARKDAKKLRYAAEFFASLFADQRGSRRYKRFIAATESLQNQLGALNDLATGPDVLDKFGLRDHPEADRLVSHANKASLIRKAQAALDEVLDEKRFWRR